MGRSERPAALGFNRTALSPPSPVLSCYDPAMGGNPLIEVPSLFGVEDSTVFTNYRRDDFFYRFYNLGGALPAVLRISNTLEAVQRGERPAPIRRRLSQRARRLS